MALKLGVITCIHGESQIAAKLARKYRKENVDAIILNGDINSDKRPLQSMVSVFRAALKAGLPVFATPGSHEPVGDYKKAVKKFRANKNLVDCSSKWGQKFRGYNLVFFPGSDFVGWKGEHVLVETKKELSRRKRSLHEKGVHAHDHIYIVMDEIAKLLKPKKTVVISHIPPRFHKPKAIDIAIFGTFVKNCKLKKKDAERLDWGVSEYRKDPEGKRFVFPVWEARRVIRLGYPMKIMKKNRGNAHLAGILRKYKITKFICGHFHESGQQGCDKKGNPIKPGNWSNELFFNAAAAKDGKGGIYTVDGEKAKFEKVNV